MPKTRKNVPWSGWSKKAPSYKQRTEMLNNCGRKCFLGPKKSFPICNKNTCKVNTKGVYAAYVRAKQYKKTSVAKKALKILKKSGVKR
jgi:hypothetical protein